MVKKSIKALENLGIKYKTYSLTDICNGVTKLESLKEFFSNRYLSSFSNELTFIRIMDPHTPALTSYYFWDALYSFLSAYHNCIFLFTDFLKFPVRGDTRFTYWESCRQILNYYSEFGWFLFNPSNKLTFENIFILQTDAAIKYQLVESSQSSILYSQDLVYPVLNEGTSYTEEELLELENLWNTVDSRVCEILYTLGLVLPEKKFSSLREAHMTKKIKYAFGIDLGTTNSCIAVSRKNTPPQVITLSKGSNTKLRVATLPSCVMYNDDGSVTVGLEAYNKRYDTERVVYSSKRDIGSDKVYQISTPNGVKKITPVDVASEVLKSLKASAEEFYGEVKDVTITVPAYFEADARHATIEAAKKAGLNVLALINEPTAAALNYAATSEESERILVYDLGGGTFDVTLLDISRADTSLADIFGEAESSNVYTKVLSTGGNRCLGGDDLDRLVAEAVVERSAQIFAEEHPEIEKPFDRFLKEDYPAAMEKIILVAEQIKKRLDTEPDAPFCDAVIDDKSICPISFRVCFNEEVFVNAAQEIFNRTTDIIEQCFKRAQVDYSTVDKVILIGGSTKLGFIRNALAEFMTKRGVASDKIYSNINPDEAVALGASVNSAIYFGESEMEIYDVLSQSIGIAEKMMIGNKVSNDQYKVLIERNSPIPQSVTYRTLIQPLQEEAHVLVYQGDERLLESNTHIGTLTLTVPCKDELQSIDITFMVDASGALRVTAESCGNKVTAQLENILRPSENKNGRKQSPALSRLANALTMYATPEDRAKGEDMINRFKDGDASVTMGDIRKFVNSVTSKEVASEQQRIQQELVAAAYATNVFNASGASAEDDDETDE